MVGLAPSNYALRHTELRFPCYRSDVSLNVIADNCGTSVRMIEKTYAKLMAEKRGDFIERATDRRALVEVDDVLVDHADAAGGNARAFGPRFDGAVDAVERVLVVLPEIHGSRTKRIA